MRFSRHARNAMRLYRIERVDVDAILALPAETGQDGRGNHFVIGYLGERRIRVVIAADDPDFVITVHERRA
jgi:hypothetical protein